ncbi:MAG: hypothetical protein Q4C98_08780, partial [Capnocytophaga sp.]|nr:hypothetical protein [Capnocytophaga sp.]
MGKLVDLVLICLKSIFYMKAANKIFNVNIQNFRVIDFAKYVFLLCFILGNIAMFGFLLTRNEDFA